MKMIAAAALLLTAAAPPPAPPCVTRAQVTDAVLFVLPALLDAAALKCAASLPADAYLLTGGKALALRLAARSEGHWAGAFAAFQQIAGEKKFPELSEQTTRGLMLDMTRGELLKGIKPTDCAVVDEAAALLAPLPPENLGGLVGLVVAMAEKDKPRPGAGPPAICPADPR